MFDAHGITAKKNVETVKIDYISSEEESDEEIDEEIDDVKKLENEKLETEHKKFEEEERQKIMKAQMEMIKRDELAAQEVKEDNRRLESEQEELEQFLNISHHRKQPLVQKKKSTPKKAQETLPEKAQETLPEKGWETVKKKKQTKNTVLLLNLYQVKRAEERAKAQEILTDNKQMEIKRTRTRMCRSIKEGKQCPHGKKCRFAHSTDELVIADCIWGRNCRKVERNNDGVYKTVVQNKICEHRHPSETEYNYYSRTGLKKVVEPEITLVKTHVEKVIKKPESVNMKVVWQTVEKKQSKVVTPFKPKVDEVSPLKNVAVPKATLVETHVEKVIKKPESVDMKAEWQKVEKQSKLVTVSVKPKVEEVTTRAEALEILANKKRI